MGKSNNVYQKLSIAWKLNDFLVMRLDFLPVERANAAETKKTYINPELPKPSLSQIAVPRRRATHEHAAVCKSGLFPLRACRRRRPIALGQKSNAFSRSLDFRVSLIQNSPNDDADVVFIWRREREGALVEVVGWPGTETGQKSLEYLMCKRELNFQNYYMRSCPYNALELKFW